MNKILFCVNSLTLGGVERRLSQLMVGLAQIKEYELFCIINDNTNFLQPEVTRYVKFIHIEYDKDINTVVKKYITTIKKISPKIIHCWTMRQCNIINLIHNEFVNNIFYICGAVNSSHKYKDGSIRKCIMDTCIQKADIIISNSQAGAIAKQIPKNKLHVIRNGYDFESDFISNHKIVENEIGNIQFIEQFKIPILMACRICPEKDIKMFMDLAASFKTNKEIIFILAGDGIDCTTSFKSEIENYGNLIFVGLKQNIGAYITRSKISVLFSKPPHEEGISNFIMESMSQKKVVIATSGGGTNEIITHNQNGLLIAPHDITQAHEEIERIINDDELYNKLADQAKMTIEKYFNFKDKLQQYHVLYKKILSQ